MTPASPTYALPLSERPAREGFAPVRPANPADPVRFVMKLLPRAEPHMEAARVGLTWPKDRAVPEYAAVRTRLGADQAGLDAVVAHANDCGLEVQSASALTRMVILSGTVAAVNRAFGIDLRIFDVRGSESYRGFDGPLYVPQALRDVIAVVAGVDDRVVARSPRLSRRRRAVEAAAPFTVPDIARMYDFPRCLRGAGQRIAMLAFYGTYSQDGLDRYFDSLSIVRPPVPVIPINGYPFMKGDTEKEPMTGMEIAGAVAPAAEVVCYFSMFTEAGWLETVTTAIHSRSLPPTVVATAYLEAEDFAGKPVAFPQPTLRELDRTFAEAALLGITVVAASGDGGSSNNESTGGLHVVFPASSPHVLACGGTMLSDRSAETLREVVWTDASGVRSGGGVSGFFTKPVWQASANVPPRPNTFAGRGLPDVAAFAERDGYSVFLEGEFTTSGGTSAAAPLWAGLIALINERLGTKVPGATVGYVTPLLYCGVGLSPAFNDIQVGRNGDYGAGSGWDPCTGWGSPNGVELMRALTQ